MTSFSGYLSLLLWLLAPLPLLLFLFYLLEDLTLKIVKKHCHISKSKFVLIVASRLAVLSTLMSTCIVTMVIAGIMGGLFYIVWIITFFDFHSSKTPVLDTVFMMYQPALAFGCHMLLLKYNEDYFYRKRMYLNVLIGRKWRQLAEAE